MVRPANEIEDDIAACKSRIESLTDDLSGLQADAHALSEQLDENQQTANQKSRQFRIEEALLANLEVELQTSQ